MISGWSIDPAERRPRGRAGCAAGTAGVIGLYDGFFGPGTGSFLVFLFVRLFGLDFLHASASAKIVNAATNAAAIILFGLTGELFWLLGLAMAACNVIGAQFGSHLAIRRGSGFVRKVFLGRRRRPDRQDGLGRRSAAPLIVPRADVPLQCTARGSDLRPTGSQWTFRGRLCWALRSASASPPPRASAFSCPC